MVNPTHNEAPTQRSGVATGVAKLLLHINAATWGGLSMVLAYFVFTNAVTFLVDFSQALDRAIWSLVKAVLWGVGLSAACWAFRFKYRAEQKAIQAERALVPPGQAPGLLAPENMGQTWSYLLLHFGWTLMAATVGLYYLAHAASNAELNVWGLRLLVVMGCGLLGSLAIMVVWLGQQSVWTARFWGAWLVITLLCVALATPLAMLLVEI